ncbi:MAG TPA: cytochrome b/b6 domain-containing protein [Paraburkholderia sp.]|jgi:cytochrome b|nr:cytochrome b/b6 domain-containing protein [Paraburkholderia sp.]
MTATSAARIKVWDLWVRLTHWTIAGIVVWNLFGPTDPLHRWLGYAAAGLAALRIVWGFCGTRHARFSGWWPSRRQLAAYLHSLARGRPSHHVSHNPLGALMAMLLWVLVFALAVSGWLMRTDRYWGEDWPQALHMWLSIALEVCVCVHIGAAIVMSLWLRENLIGAMLTGTKKPADGPKGAHTDGPHGASVARTTSKDH